MLTDMKEDGLVVPTSSHNEVWSDIRRKRRKKKGEKGIMEQNKMHSVVREKVSPLCQAHDIAPC